MARQQRARYGNKAKGRRSEHNRDTGKYVRQRIRTEANKRRRLKRHLEKHPNDLHAHKIHEQK